MRTLRPTTTLAALAGLAACAATDPAPPVEFDLAERLAIEPAAPPADCETRVVRFLERGGAPREHGIEVVHGGSAAPGLVPVTFAGAVAAPSTEADCLLLIDGHATGGIEREVGRPETVASTYIAGVAREPNPAFAAARLRAEHAERRARQQPSSGIITTGNPEVDLVGTLLDALVGGAAGRRRHRQLEEALDALAETPSHIEHESRAPYSFTRTPVTLTRHGRVRLAVLDGGRLRQAEAPVTLRETFYRYDGLDPRDVDHAAHAARRADPERLLAFERGPLELRAEALLAALQGALPEQRHADIQPAAPPPSQAVVAAAAQHEPSSLVLVEGAGGIAAGFHLAPDRVVTAAGALGTSSVADVRTADGTRVAALVMARSDGVALLQVPRPGPPMALAPGPTPSTAELWSFDASLAPMRAPVALAAGGMEPDALPGSPLVTPEGVVGMLLGPGGEARIAPASTIAALAGRGS
jgi:hypothetical protein